MNEPPINNLDVLKGLDPTERELTISRLIVEVHDWLTTADEKTSLEDLSNLRAYARDISDAAVRLDLSPDLRLDAQLVLRLAERAVAKTVRRHQVAGEMGGLTKNNNRKLKLPSPAPYVGSGNTAHTMYLMTDNVTNAQFAAALKVARDDGNMSRSHVVRKIVEVRTGKKTDPRGSVVDESRDLAEQLRKVVRKLRLLTTDDRLGRNKAEVAARMRPYLAEAVEVCTDLQGTLDAEEKDEGK